MRASERSPLVEIYDATAKLKHFSHILLSVSLFFLIHHRKSATLPPHETSHLCYATPFADGVLGRSQATSRDARLVQTCRTSFLKPTCRDPLRQACMVQSEISKSKIVALIFHCRRAAAAVAIDERTAWHILYIRCIGCMSWVSGR